MKNSSLHIYKNLKSLLNSKQEIMKFVEVYHTIISELYGEFSKGEIFENDSDNFRII